uniref:Uncharacterized protein n=1 Tax=Megaselia scalaris TaxID=36166 RepID=T1GDT2_MEGSC
MQHNYCFLGNKQNQEKQEFINQKILTRKEILNQWVNPGCMEPKYLVKFLQWRFMASQRNFLRPQESISKVLPTNGYCKYVTRKNANRVDGKNNLPYPQTILPTTKE